MSRFAQKRLEDKAVRGLVRLGSAPRSLEVHDTAQFVVPLLADSGLYAECLRTVRGTA